MLFVRNGKIIHQDLDTGKVKEKSVTWYNGIFSNEDKLDRHLEDNNLPILALWIKEKPGTWTFQQSETIDGTPDPNSPIVVTYQIEILETIPKDIKFKLF